MILTKKKYFKDDADQILIEKIKKRKFDEVLIIFPTNRKVRYYTKHLLEISECNSVANLKIHTLSTFSFAIFNELYRYNYFLLDDATAIIKLKKIIQKERLKYFRFDEDSANGILFEIKNVISDFKKKGITADVLENDLDSLTGAEKDKVEDIIKIYRIYKSECLTKKLFELGDIYEIIVQANTSIFNRAFQQIFPKVDFILIDEFDEFSNLEIKILDMISLLVENFFIKIDYKKDNDELFGHIKKTVNKLKAAGFYEYEESHQKSSGKFLSKIKKHLFTYSIKKIESDIKLQIHTAQNRNEEVVFIAKTLKKFLINSNYSPERICVAFNNISKYSKIIDEVFDDFGIPYNLTDRFLLSNSPPIISLISFLEIVENDFYYKNIFRALSGIWIEIPNIDKLNLVVVSSNLKIISGYENWITKIENVLRDYDSNFDTDFNFLPKELYQKALEDIKTIHSYLSPFEVQLTPNEFLEQITNLLIKLDLLSKCVNESGIFTEKNSRALTKFIELLNNLIKIIEIEYGNKKQSLSFYIDNIKSATQFTRYNVKEKSGIIVTSVDEIRGLNFDLLIIGGLIDGDFPSRYSPEILIPDKYKIFEEGHLLQERYRFYQALKTVNDRIILTYPKNDDEVNVTISSILKDLNSIVDIETLNDDKGLICSNYEIRKNILVDDLCNLRKDELFNHKIELENLRQKIDLDKKRRLTPFEVSPFNGFIKINDQFKDLIYSACTNFSSTTLEEYVKCPFQFFLKRIIKLKALKEPVEEVESIEIGRLLHSILFEFYNEINERNLMVQECSDQSFNQFLDLIFSIAERKVKKESFDNSHSFFELEKIFGINGNREYSILYKFLQEERKIKYGFQPKFFEKKFGGYEYSSVVKVDDINIQGSIDRIDINFEKKLFSVIDYKLRGKNISKDEITEGISLQLPLYLFAAKKILEYELKDYYEPFSAEIYSLKFSEKDFGRKIIHNSSARNMTSDKLVEINNQMINIFIETIKNSVEKIKNGEFNLSKLKNREDKVCNYCDFISVCRVSEILE
ncbi:MAG: exodeoxyribonuclease V subunit gamma [Ignavibacterium sp.]|nr:exodeoxyribonuclease V subunit gamma [Ignavibacterium sp.]